VRIYADTRRYAKYAAICVAAGLLGVLVARSTLLIGVPVAAIFFALAVFLVGVAVSGPPRITIDEDGLGGADLPRQLAWAELASIEHTTRPARYGKLHFLQLTLTDGESLQLPLSGLLTPTATIVAAVEGFQDVARPDTTGPDPDVP
jgi:hypothetical protein